MKSLFSIALILFAVSAEAKTYVIARCGEFALKSDETGTVFTTEYQNQEIPTTFRNLPNESDMDISTEGYLAMLPGGSVEFIRTVSWYDHRDRVRDIQTAAVLKTAEKTTVISCQ